MYVQSYLIFAQHITYGALWIHGTTTTWTKKEGIVATGWNEEEGNAVLLLITASNNQKWTTAKEITQPGTSGWRWR
jgi:hypothetical protein